jgi:preprotein translocase subunit SecG
MLALKIFLILFEIICGALLIGVILLQKAKGEGLGLAFGAEMGESIFGARASNVLVKITIWLGAFFIINTVLLATIYSNTSRRSVLGTRPRPPIEQPVAPGAQKESAPPASTVPELPLPSQPVVPQQGVATPTPSAQ